MDKNNIVNNPETLKELVLYQDSSVVSKIIMRSKAGSLTLFAFDKGEFLSEHTAPYDAFALIMEGCALIKVGEKEHHLAEGEAIIMPANVPHSVYAEDRFKMLLAMFKAEIE